MRAQKKYIDESEDWTNDKNTARSNYRVRREEEFQIDWTHNYEYNYIFNSQCALPRAAKVVE